MKPALVYHYSEDPGIREFRPHIPTTNPDCEPLVWAIDAEHAPLYWFPRECPRVTYWAGPDTPAGVISRFLGHGASRRIHAIECAWLERVRQATVYAYRFDAGPFAAWAAADGHWVSREAVAPRAVEPVGDLLQRHTEAGIELRITPSLWPLHDAVVGSGLCFSMVRMCNAKPRVSDGGA